MKRLGIPLAGAFALALASAAALQACGGSASETPPPLQPDPHGFHYAGVAAAERDASDAGAVPAATDTDEDDGKPRAPARSTWGAAPPRH